MSTCRLKGRSNRALVCTYITPTPTPVPYITAPVCLFQQFHSETDWSDPTSMTLAYYLGSMKFFLSLSVVKLALIFTARQHSKAYAKRCTSCDESVCLTVRHTLLLCQNDPSYDHAVLLENSPIAVVSLWLTLPRTSKGNIGSAVSLR